MVVLSVALHGGAGVGAGVRHLSGRTVAGVRVIDNFAFGGTAEREIRQRKQECLNFRALPKTVDYGRDSLYKSGRTGVYRARLCERGNRTELVRVPLPGEGRGVDSLRPGAGLEP